MHLSIVIPVWNEQDKIGQDIQEASDFLQSEDMHGEVLVVDDGSSDETVHMATECVSAHPGLIRIIRCGQHYGKGFAVRRGILESRGDIVLFIDSGSCVSYHDVHQGLRLIRQNRCEIALASRYMTGSRILRSQSFIRRLISFGFRKACQLIFHMPGTITDTQCGLKIFKGEAAVKLFSRCRCQGFLLDIEVIQQALSHGMSIQTFPVHWRSDPDSRLSVFRDFPGFLKDFICLMRHDFKRPN